MSGNEERILRTIEKIHPDWISNSRLGSISGVRPHQQVFQITCRLRKNGLIASEQRGREWFFRCFYEPQAPTKAVPPKAEPAPQLNSSKACYSFESRARAILSSHLGRPLAPANLPKVPKRFDLVSTNGEVIGDAKFFDMVRGTDKPSAKFSIIAEHVWLLEKTNARCKFLVFGNNRLVPIQWLKKYGNLVGSVAFVFLDEEGQLEVLSDPGESFAAIADERRSTSAL